MTADTSLVSFTALVGDQVEIVAGDFICISADHLHLLVHCQFSFTLREIARWHDGRPITADDVVFSFETLTTKGSPQYRFIYRGVSLVEKLSARRIRFTLLARTNFEPNESRKSFRGPLTCFGITGIGAASRAKSLRRLAFVPRA